MQAPPTTVHGSTSRVTTAPEATTAPAPTFTQGRMVTRELTYARSSISTGAPLLQKLGFDVVFLGEDLFLGSYIDCCRGTSVLKGINHGGMHLIAEEALRLY